MKEERKYFGYSESEIRETFYSKEDMKPVSTPKVEPEKSTTETLKESSEKLLKENPEFLRDVYGM